MSSLRAILVGAGSMGRTWAQTMEMNQEVDFIGWVDVDVERVIDGIGELHLENVAVDDSIDAAVEKLHPDFVVDVSVPEAHHPVTASCLRRKVPVLGEKPLAATLEEARDLVALSESTSTLFAVSQNRRYNEGLAAFRELLTGTLHGVGQLSAEFYRAPHFGGFRDEMASPLLIDMAIHTFDAARYLTGEDPVSVSCSEFNPEWVSRSGLGRSRVRVHKGCALYVSGKLVRGGT